MYIYILYIYTYYSKIVGFGVPTVAVIKGPVIRNNTSVQLVAYFMLALA
jgi:hypothetical protein